MRVCGSATPHLGAGARAGAISSTEMSFFSRLLLSQDHRVAHDSTGTSG